MRGLNKYVVALFLLISGIAFSVRAEAASSTSDDYHDDEDYGEEEEIPEGAVPRITSPPKSIVVDEGKKVEFPCKGEHLKYFAIFWSRRDDLLASNDLTVTGDKRFSITVSPNGNSLVIDKVTSKDNGEYTCKVHKGDNATSIVTHKLTVNERRIEMPKVWTPELKVVKANEPAQIYCNVTAGHPEPRVFWERKGKKMPNGEQVVEGNSVLFASVSRHHAGVYECFANNSLGTARTAMTLHVNHAPEIEVERESINSGLSVDAELVCIVHAEPKATVQWYKDGRPVASSKHHAVQRQSHHWILHIMGVDETDYGNYACVARNTMGRVQKIIELSGKPSQPILRKSFLGKDALSYHLEYILESATEITGYKLRWRKVEGGDWADVDVKGEQNPSQQNVYVVSYVLTDLEHNTDYEVTLLALNKEGWSKEAQPRSFHVNGESSSGCARVPLMPSTFLFFLFTLLPFLRR